MKSWEGGGYKSMIDIYITTILNSHLGNNVEIGAAGSIT